MAAASVKPAPPPSTTTPSTRPPGPFNADDEWRRIKQAVPRPLDGTIRPLISEPAVLKLRPGAVPVQRWHTRAVAIPLLEGFDAEVDEMLDQDLMEQADDVADPSEWVHPAVVVAKKPPTPHSITPVRICVDFTPLNREMVPIAKSTPPPKEKVASIPTSACYFTVLDGRKGYHQVLLHPDSRKYTTSLFAHRGRFRLPKERLPMGCATADAIFTEKWEEIIRPHDAYTRSVVEDVLIWGATPEECADRTLAVLRSFDAVDASINTEKVQFCKESVLFGGFVVSRGRYCIDPKLTADLRNFPPPTSRTELRSFFGLAQQMGSFNDSLTKALEPLRGLNKDATRWMWTQHHQAAFEKARTILSGKQHLAFFDKSRPTRLSTDASRVAGLGFLLEQKGTDGLWRLVQCGSRSLATHEANWSGVAELEALAAAWACKKCAYFLEGLQPFTLLTDNMPLKHIINNKRQDQLHNDRLLKLRTYLSRFNITAEHVPGRLHKAADALSRIPGTDPSADDIVLSERDDALREFALAASVSALTALSQAPTGSAQATTATTFPNPPITATHGTPLIGPLCCCEAKPNSHAHFVPFTL